MQSEVQFAGFGGQGILLSGKILASAAMAEGLEVAWVPSYGPEMRGGKARCTVIISDEEIGSPLVRRPSASIVLNIATTNMSTRRIRRLTHSPITSVT